MTSESDTLTQFFFAHSDVRGALVKLGNSFVEALNGRDYPAGVHRLLGECLAGATLMNTHVKSPTRLTLQARGDGPVSLLMAESILKLPAGQRELGDANTLHQTVRACARYNEASQDLLVEGEQSLADMLGRAQLAITLEPENGQRYQGIVSACETRLESCLEAYFEQSEQLATVIRLATGSDCAAGLLLQRLPSAHTGDSESGDAFWEEIAILARSIQARELLELPASAILHRLFHQHDYRVGQPQPVAFACTCSLARTGAALLQIDAREVAEILEQEGEIVMDCEFCSARYRFDRAAIDQLSIEQQATRH